MSVRESDMFYLSFLLFLRQMMLSLDILGSNVQRASAYRNLIRMFFFFPFFFCIKNGEKGQGKEIGLSGSLSINLTRKI